MAEKIIKIGEKDVTFKITGSTPLCIYQHSVLTSYQIS